MPSIVETLLRPEVMVPNGLCLVGFALAWLATSPLRRRPQSDVCNQAISSVVPENIMEGAKRQRETELKQVTDGELEALNSRYRELTAELKGDELVAALHKYQNRKKTIQRRGRR